MTADDGSGYDAGPYLPAQGGLAAHRRAAADCRGCPLFGPATRTVFGKGPADARIVLVGEQPGDQEDRRGEPFVGPAGRLLGRALEDAGLGDEPAYVTNAVKHFKFAVGARGKRRIHKPPSLRELSACRPWLAAELRLLEPEAVVALGATAGRALLGPSFRVTKDRGKVLELPQGTVGGGRGGGTGGAAGGGAGGGTPGGGDGGTGTAVVATLHPSAVLRADDREEVFAGLVADLRVVAGLLRGTAP